jgi:hypothetical protein
MGGFEGGDEAGFWEVDENTFHTKTSKASNETKYQIIEDDLSYKITASGYEETIVLLPFESKSLTIEGYQTDIISKAYHSLVDFTNDMEIVEFYHQHKIFIQTPKSQKVDETILGALFILLTKDICNLVLNGNEIEEIAQNIGTSLTPFQ